MIDEISKTNLYKTVKIQLRINECIYIMLVKLLKFKKSVYYFQQTQNRDIANFHGAVLATDV